MEINITTKSLIEITKEERRRLNYLTLRYASLMRDDVLQADEYLDEYQIFFAQHENKIIGWAVVFPGDLSTDPYKEDGKHYIYTYVQTIHRRNGIGKKLLAAASDWAKEKGFQTEVFAWNPTSENFFNSCRELPIEIVVEYV